MPYCKHCGAKLAPGAHFCEECGTKIESTNEEKGSPETETRETAPDLNTTTDSVATPTDSGVTIKCGNCGYIGPGEPGRKLYATILAWCCVVIFWPLTLIYYVSTSAYRCPKCHSTFIGIKRRNDSAFMSQSQAKRSLRIFLYVILGIAIIGILSAVVLASLNTAREKASQAAGASQQSYGQSY